MKKLTAYQKRKKRQQEHDAYMLQYIGELQKLVELLMKQLTDAGIAPTLPLGSGVTGDSFLTPITMGEFPPPYWYAVRHSTH